MRVRVGLNEEGGLRSGVAGCGTLSDEPATGRGVLVDCFRSRGAADVVVVNGRRTAARLAIMGASSARGPPPRIWGLALWQARERWRAYRKDDILIAI